VFRTKDAVSGTKHLAGTKLCTTTPRNRTPHGRLFLRSWNDVLVEARWGCEATVLSTVSLVSGLFGQSARL